ncbi:MAG: hypothetical protein KIT09_18070 [Bryobacteraceae bacterium]|nr:hypothetical protein [Bryobacteraceae bacterium]
MTHRQAIQARERLLQRLSSTAELLRGSLLQRTTRHSHGCPKCARGEGHPQSVLTVSYPGGRTRQFSVSAEQVPQVRRWLRNYRKLKETIEAICELNHILLRPDSPAPNPRRVSRD